MRVIYAANFARQFDAVPAEVQRAFRKQVSLLVEKLRHPALRAKARDIWQARVTGSWRSISESRMTLTRFSRSTPIRSEPMARQYVRTGLPGSAAATKIYGA
jgi:hypothetical protein